MPTTVITGCNRGIGLELARACAIRGDDVVALCRTPSDDLRATGARIEADIDVGRDDVVDVLRERLAGVTVDTLINNAGVLATTSLDNLDFDSIRRQLEVNSLGPLRVTSALAGNLHQGSKVAIVTSRMGSIDDNTSGGHYGYRMSKCAVNMAGKSLAVDLAGRGVAVVLLHPGFVKTAMTGGGGMVEADESAAGLLARIDDLTLESSGSFFHANGERLPW